MSRTFAVDASAQSVATPESVWALLTDAPTWVTWAAVCNEAVVESGHGLGEIRRFRLAPVPGLAWPRLTVRERTTFFERPHHWAYEMLSGLPGVTDYTAHVTLVGTAGGGTAIGWHVSFASGIPGLGPVLRGRLKRLYGDAAADLATAARG
jgi:Polyketide cyclase / dehydrase and lipid transport